MMYIKRRIDGYLEDWVRKQVRKPLLLRGARQVGKSTAVRNLSKGFKYFVEVNFEKQPEYKAVRNYLIAHRGKTAHGTMNVANRICSFALCRYNIKK